MATKWEFDKKFLENVINKGYVLLEDPNISKTRKKSIKTDINTFQRFINNDFENRITDNSKPPIDFEKLKDYILRKMKKQYDQLSPELILWTMDLCYERIFELDGTPQQTKLTMDEQEELTLENYAKNSKIFYIPAKQILSNEIIKQIQEVHDMESSSYCYRAEITELPYLLIDPSEEPWILNHETEHAVEEIRKYQTNRLYDELGPIFFEMLYNDLLYERQGHLHQGDYSDRISDCEYGLNTLYGYFNAMLTFANASFNVPTPVFKKVFLELTDITEEELYDYLREEIATSEKLDDMTYLFSYLKAIELREKANAEKQDCSYILDPYLKSKKFNFTPSKESFATYRRFTEEMKSKTKIK